MRKEIYVSVLFFVFCLFALSIYGQSESLEQLRKKFEAGLRESSFLEDYWNRLKLSHEDAVLKEKVLDCYLLSLPLSERYTQDRMIDIVSQIQTIQANVIADIMINWDSLSLNLDQKQMVLEKIDQLLALNCFNWIIQQQNKQLALGCFNWITQQQNQSKIELPLLKDLEEHLNTASVPLSKFRIYFVQLWNYFVKRQLDECVIVFCSLLNENVEIGLRDFITINTINYFMLDNCDLEQCTQILAALDNNLKCSSNLTWANVKKLYEGRKMMLEMGEE